METEDERARLENDAATKRLRLVMETEEERKARLVKMVATTQLRLALEAEDERRNMDELYLYLIRIEIGVFKNFKECARSPCNGNHFSSVIGLVSIYMCVCVCVQKKIVIERTRDLIYLKFVATEFFQKIISPSAGENSGDSA